MSYSYKRKRRDTLTGGTNDVNPQYMNIQVIQTAVDTYAQQNQQIPIQRLQNQGRAQVMEVLKVFFQSSDISTTTVGVTLRQLQLTLTTKSFAGPVPPALNEPTLFAFYQKGCIQRLYCWWFRYSGSRGRTLCLRLYRRSWSWCLDRQRQHLRTNPVYSDWNNLFRKH